MKPLTKSLVLFLVLFFYAFLYWATKVEKCEEDCLRQTELNSLLRKDRAYVSVATRCYSGYSLDTLCVYVRDTTGINWNLFADTACMYVKSVGFTGQTLLVLNNQVFPPDTLARKQCP